MVAASSHLFFNPLTSPICNSKKKLSSDLSPDTLKLGSFGPTTNSSTASLSLKKLNYGKGLSSGFSVVCKAVSVKPDTQVEGLNIADDVTQGEGSSQWLATGVLKRRSCVALLQGPGALHQF